jgi:hypothetical protein
VSLPISLPPHPLQSRHPIVDVTKKGYASKKLKAALAQT